MDLTTPNNNFTLCTLGADFNTWGIYTNQNWNTADTNLYGINNLVPTAGININAALSFNSFSLTNAKTVVFTGQANPPSNLQSVWFDSPNGNFWIEDGAGNQIQVTLNGALNIASAGGFNGDYTAPGSTANAQYYPLSGFGFFANSTTIPASITGASIYIGQVGASNPNYIQLASPNSLAGAYTLILPTALPAATQLVSLTSGGQLTAGVTPSINGGLTLSSTLTATTATITGNETVGGTLGVTGTTTLGTTNITGGDNLTLGASSVLVVPSNGQIQNSGTLTQTGTVNPGGQTFTISEELASASVVTGFVTLTGTVGSSPNLTDLKSVFENNRDYVMGYVTGSTGALVRGYNCSVTRSTTGTYVITFLQGLYSDTAANKPIVTATCFNTDTSTNYNCQVTSILQGSGGNTGLWGQITIVTLFNNALEDSDFMFRVC